MRANPQKPTHTHTHTCNFLIAIFLSVFSIFSVYSVPSFATNVDSGEDATCDEDTLESQTGPVRLRAEYQPEVINLNWYDENGNQITVPNASNSCTYDTSINLPDNPTKTGYTFKGWRVVPKFDLSTLDSAINGNGRYAHGVDIENNNTDSCMCNGDTCTCNTVSDLNQYEWKATFEYGTVYGETRCSSVSGEFTSTGNPTNDNGPHCWCRATKYKPNNDNMMYETIASTPWIADYRQEGVSSCARNCGYYECAFRVQTNSVFRSAVFGISNN